MNLILAGLDFGLTPDQMNTVLARGQETVASLNRYSLLRERVGTLLALQQPELRRGENVLARECSLFCSAFVQRLFRRAGIDLAPGVNDKHTTPEDISRTRVPHLTYLLQRETVRSKLKELRQRLRRRVGARVRMLKRRVGEN